MQAAKLKPDVITYTGLINAYSKARRVEEAQAVFREMVASGVR
jgi:pentatricopeptide repeat protein